MDPIPPPPTHAPLQRRSAQSQWAPGRQHRTPTQTHKPGLPGSLSANGLFARRNERLEHIALSRLVSSRLARWSTSPSSTHTRALHTRHVLSTSPSFIVSCIHSALARRDACHRHCNDLYPRIHVPLRLLERAQATLQLHRTKVHRRSHARLVVVHGQVVGHQHKGGRCPMHLAARPHRALA